MFAKMNFSRVVRNTRSFQEGSYEKALSEALVRLDLMLVSEEGSLLLNRIQETLEAGGYSINRGNAEYLAGSTAIVALVTKEEVFVANAGDCRAVTVKNDKITR